MGYIRVIKKIDNYINKSELGYTILNFLNANSYFRKSIGYLYAIDRGAKEIYEIDEDLEFCDFDFSNNIFKNNNYVSYANRKYNKYPNYKGYLFLNDDLFLKTWELNNLNFSLPWFNQYTPIKKYWFHYKHCLSLYNMYNKKNKWKNNIISFNGYFDIIIGFSDFYYLPNYYASKINIIFEEMYKSKIFLESAIPNSMGILLAPEYQVIIINSLLGTNKNSSINYHDAKHEQIIFIL